MNAMILFTYFVFALTQGVLRDSVGPETIIKVIIYLEWEKKQ